MNYAEFRARQIRYEGYGRFTPRTVLINNTGNSRQVRRQRARKFDDAPLPARVVAAIAKAYPEQGFFMRRGTYTPAWVNELRVPSADYSIRYSALFALPSGSAGS